MVENERAVGKKEAKFFMMRYAYVPIVQDECNHYASHKNVPKEKKL